MRLKIQAKVFLALLVLWLSCPQGLLASTYILDHNKSSVKFKASHISDGIVEGSFTQFLARLDWDKSEQLPKKIQGSIQVSSIKTDNKVRDRHLKSRVFFYEKKHPEIIFVSEKIDKTKEGILVTGTVKIRGIPISISLAMKLKKEKESLILTGRATLNRHDFEVSAYKRLISPSIETTFSLRFRPQKNTIETRKGTL